MPVVVRWLVLCFSFYALAGCSSLYRWESSHASGVRIEEGGHSYYIVEEGDTLYSIAFQAGKDYRQIAAWNGIGWPYRIYPSQKLRLSPPPKSPPVNRRKPAPRKSSRSDRSAGGSDTRREARIATSTSVRWQWPVYGPILNNYSKKGNGRNGMSIGGRLGEPVRAAAAGRVVYSGSGLRGYGKLIIIKHNDVYLSAYGHNRKLLVKEGETLQAGQVIAELGDTDADRPMLHFEIRRDGEPVDPRRLLPKR
ncbi:MAG: peptidoglycan DD-metalloendopeptidase family protein [Gammaproteobacteria bacterium]